MFRANAAPALALSLWAVVAGSACFYTSAPSGWLPQPSEAQQQAYGGWMSVQISAPYVSGGKQYIEGELIAAGADSIHVLSDDGLVDIPLPAITEATLTTYDANLGTLTTWTLVGTLSTASHGVLLIISAPVWIIAGSAFTASASKTPRVRTTEPAFLRPYARFPQGLPADLDRSSLKPKPRVAR